MKGVLALITATLFGVLACHEPGSTSTPAAGLAVGSPAPTVSMTLHDGRVLTLEELRGHNVLIYFYPTATNSTPTGWSPA